MGRLRIERESARSAMVVRVGGALDLDSVEGLARELEAAVTSAVRQSIPVLAVDLEDVTYFGSAGLNAVLLCHERGSAAGISVRVVAANPWVVRPLEVTGLDTILRLHESLADALRSGDADPRP
ncbi:STAS domain-containing protein [Nocardia yunnanensis]|uniref:STAS domain-containing protein n=1 Tax=Nocardia yunnanensis TaxID=2382165 RepID=UPI001FEAE2D3|nr:STAS domain-containing protein [Nocardia yunnanensis]